MAKSRTSSKKSTSKSKTATSEMTDRWIAWIESSEYRERLHSIEDHVRTLSSEKIDTSYFTPHGLDHCLSVEKMVKALIEKSKVEFSDLEKFILFSAVLTHDLGMFKNVALKYFDEQNDKKKYSPQIVRDKHDEISAWYLYSNFGEIMKSDIDENEELKVVGENRLRNYVNTINVISKFHRMKENINDCPKERFLKGEKLRTRLLACFLRLGDTLHVDSSRFDRRLYDVLQIGQFDRSARLRWLKTYVVSNVYLDPEDETVYINVDLPVSSSLSKNNELYWEENSKNLQNAIINDISVDLLVVMETFREYGLPTYTRVIPNITFVPGYSQKDSKEIEGIVSDLSVNFSPNTSKVIEKALDSIISLCSIKFDNWEHFYNQMEQLISYLKEDVLEKRPCHVGLSRIIGTAEVVFNNFPNYKSKNISIKKIRKYQKDISKKIKVIKKEREENLEKLYKKCEGNLLEGVENIILFAYSEIVTKFLEEYGRYHPPWKERLNLYVFECSGKKRLGIRNDIQYNDGLYYAFQLSKHNFKNINLLPDTSIGPLFFNLERKKEVSNSLILFGVNGISEEDEYACGHTSGHLAIAIIAKKYKIPVKIISDSFKIGKKIEWKPEMERESSWLTGQRNMHYDLVQKNIKLINYLEDRIPRELITEIITEEEENIQGGRFGELPTTADNSG